MSVIAGRLVPDSRAYRFSAQDARDQNDYFFAHLQKRKEYINNERKILSDRLSCIDVTKEKFGIIKSNEEIVYKLTGGLATRYQIRPHEKIIDNHLPEYIVISNFGETPEMLLPRLARYDNLCEVKKPNIVREEMKKILNETLANYGE